MRSSPRLCVGLPSKVTYEIDRIEAYSTLDEGDGDQAAERIALTLGAVIATIAMPARLASAITMA